MQCVAKSKGLSNLLHYLDDFQHGVYRIPFCTPGNVQISGKTGGNGEAGGSSNMFGISRDMVEMVLLVSLKKAVDNY